MRATKQRRPVGWGDAEWQKMKAARMSIDHNAAAQLSAYLEKQFRNQWSSKVAPSPVNLNDVLRTLTQKRIPFVLTGAHAIGGWTGRPRSTQDIDILVKGGRNHARAVKALNELYPQLETRTFFGLTGFFIPGERASVIDVIYPHRPDMQDTLEHPIWTEDKAAGLRYRIPSLEAALANKYGAMINFTRDLGKRAIDVGDFTFMVLHSMDEGQKPIDLQKLLELGEMVWPGGGGAEILRLVEDVKAGRLIDLTRAGKRS
jgi:hypothetical protein